MKDFRELLEADIEEQKYRLYKSVRIGKFDISIQGSEKHFCTPRLTTNLYEYSKMEIAICENGKWISILNDKRFNDFNIKIKWDESDRPIAEYVDISAIQALCDYIEKNLI